MNNFTIEELYIIAECVEDDFYRTNWSREIYEPIMIKIRDLIENSEKNKEIFNGVIYILLDENYFSLREVAFADDLIPGVMNLLHEASEKIKTPGIYKIVLQIEIL